MEWVEGCHLARHVEEERRTPLEPEEATRLMLPVVRAVELMHSKGMVHRDIKPQNILIETRSKSPSPKLCDFGIAKSLETAGVSFVTANEVKGTPGFMAPEQWTDSRSVGKGADVWSLGTVLYWLLSQNLPHGPIEASGDSFDVFGEMMRRAIEEPPVPLSTYGVSGDLCEIVYRCLAKRPSERYADAGELREALEKTG
jgi:serine/threonine-protein kinase